MQFKGIDEASSARVFVVELLKKLCLRLVLCQLSLKEKEKVEQLAVHDMILL